MTVTKREHQARGYPILRVHYRDPDEGWEGMLVIDSTVNGSAIGGVRVTRTVDIGEVSRLARGMTLKNSYLGLGVGGAQSAIRYDPNSTTKKQALERFFSHVAPLCEAFYAFTADMNTAPRELDDVAAAAGIKWRLGALVQGGDRDQSRQDYLRALALPSGPFSLGETRTGLGIAACVERARLVLGLPETLRIAIQGFGESGLGAAWALTTLYKHEVVAVADAGGTYRVNDGFELDDLRTAKQISGGPLEASALPGAEKLPVAAVMTTPCDVLILAGAPDAVTVSNAPEVQARLVVEGGDIAVTGGATNILHGRGISVIPDFIASGGAVTFAWGVTRGGFPHDDAQALVRRLTEHLGDAAQRALETARAQNIPVRQALLPSIGELDADL